MSSAIRTLTVFHPESAGTDALTGLASPLAGFDAVILPTAGRAIELLIARAERRGPVIVLVEDEREAERVLLSGADEVVLLAEADRENVERAARRAVARAEGMERRDARSSRDRRQLSASSLEALLGGACLQVEVALEQANERCDLLRQLVSQGMAEELQTMSRRSASLGVSRQSAVEGPDDRRRSGDPGSIVRSVDEVSASLGQAIEIASRLKSLLLPAATSFIDLREVLVEIVALVRPAVETIAEFVVTVPEESCIVRLPRWQAIQAIGGLLTNAVRAARERGGNDRFILLRLVREHGDAAVEVSDDGVGLAENEIEVALGGADDPKQITPDLVRLAFAASVARQGKGELLISSRPSEGTTARMYIALAEAG